MGTNVRSRPVFRHGHGIAADQPSLLVTLDERLEPGHFVRRLLPLVDEVLGAELRASTSLAGGFSYDPVNVLSVLLYAYMQGERSCHKMEELCRYDVRYEFLAGSCRPDYSTLTRFRCGLGETLDSLMSRVCAKAEADGILKRKAMAVDGTKVAARMSQWRKAREESEQQDAALEEAVTMVSHGHYLVGYNVQVAADMDSTLVVGYLVSDRPEDSGQMKAVLEVIEKQSGKLSEQVVADRGYGSSANALAVKEAGVVGFLPSSRPGRTAPFTCGEDGLYRCTAGHRATQRQWLDKRNNKVYRHLRVSRCSKCEHASKCPGKGRQRTMKVLESDAMDEKHACIARCRTPEAAL